MKKILFSIALLLAALVASGQTNKDELMVVYLKDGSIIEGYISEWNYGETLRLKSKSGGISYVFPADKIEKVQQKSLMEIGNEYTFNESGKYFAWRGQGIIGNEGTRANETPGYGFSFLAGYRLNRFVGLGVGVGYDKYIDDTSEELIPVFAEFSGYALAKNTSLSYSLALGYSFAQADPDNRVINAEGGLLIYPSIGLRFGRGPVKYTIDLGYKFQDATFTYLDPWNGSTRYEQDLKYKRLTLRFGIMI